MSSVQWYSERLKEDLHREITWAIVNKVNDPRVPDIVTVAGIKLAPDTRNATVFISIYSDEEKKRKALLALNGAASFIQKIVSSRINIKHFPKLYFKLDDSFEKSERINNLLGQIKNDLA